MNICAIICELNPFHYGHLYIVQRAKELSGADAMMCIQSGHFTQRGEPAVTNKYVRSRMAIEGGFDIVVQIPTAYSCSSAEIFATAGVKIANSFDNVTHLAFGVETANPSLLIEIADFLSNETDEYRATLQKYLDAGNSLPVSRQKAIEEMIKEDKVEFSEISETINILSKPNNILAIEYLKALKKTNSKIVPVFIPRVGSEYSDDKINGKFSSALAIRQALEKSKVKKIKKLVPLSTYEIIKEEEKVFGMPDNELYNNLCMYKLKTSSKDDYKRIFDVTEGIENRFIDSASRHKDLNELLLDVKTKRYTYTRLKRIVLQMLLDVDKSVIKELYKIDRLPYIKVLAFNGEQTELLKGVSANTNLIIRNSNIVKKKDDLYKALANIEDRANAVYNLLLTKNKALPSYSPDLYTKCVKVD